MNPVFIVAEYNPFHNGHEYMLSQLAGAGSITAVMSGDFVQRGGIALCGKFVRAQAAVECGINLVLENPVKYAVSNARRFAFGAVSVIKATGVKAPVIAFGASAGADELKKLSLFLFEHDSEINALPPSYAGGRAYPFAVAAFVSEKLGAEYASLLDDPNNVLAAEYMRASLELGLDCGFFAVNRSVGHNSGVPDGDIAPAGLVRDALYGALSSGAAVGEALKYIPRKAKNVFVSAAEKGRFPVDGGIFDSIAVSRLLDMTAEEFALADNVNGGLENRLACAVRNNNTLPLICDSAKSKNITHARVRQIAVSSVLGIRKSDYAAGTEYIRVLGFDGTGREMLGFMRKNAVLPVVTVLSDAPCGRDRDTEYLAGKIMNLCLGSPEPGNTPYLAKPFIKA